MIFSKEKGIELTPTIIELTLWSDNNARELHSEVYSGEWIEKAKTNKCQRFDYRL